MNYGELVSEALRITWRNKFLWFFGFFVALGSGGGGGGGGGGGSNFDNQDFSGIASVSTVALQEGPSAGLVILGLLLGLAAFLVFLFLYVVSDGGLTGSVADIDRRRPSGFSVTFRTGLRKFWGVLALILLFLLIVFVLLAVVGIPLVLLVAGAFSTESAAFRVVAVLIAIPVVLVLLFVAFIVVAVIRQFARRALVVDGEGIFPAIGSGYRLFRQNVGRSLLVWLVQFLAMIVAGLAAIAAILLVGLVLALPAILLIAAEYVTLAVIAGVVAALIFIPFLLAVMGALGTFNHAYWTLAYMRLTRPPGDPLEPVAAAV